MSSSGNEEIEEDLEGIGEEELAMKDPADEMTKQSEIIQNPDNLPEIITIPPISCDTDKPELTMAEYILFTMF